jgi:hypothetical protein
LRENYFLNVIAWSDVKANNIKTRERR